MYRQGDVLIIAVPEAEIAKAEQDGKPVLRENDRLILAHGETTGHAHAILEPHVNMIAVADNQFLRAAEPFAIVHEEHAPVYVPAGTFRVIRQREYAPSNPSAFVHVSD